MASVRGLCSAPGEGCCAGALWGILCEASSASPSELFPWTQPQTCAVKLPLAGVGRTYRVLLKNWLLLVCIWLMWAASVHTAAMCSSPTIQTCSVAGITLSCSLRLCVHMHMCACLVTESDVMCGCQMEVTCSNVACLSEQQAIPTGLLCLFLKLALIWKTWIYSI